MRKIILSHHPWIAYCGRKLLDGIWKLFRFTLSILLYRNVSWKKVQRSIWYIAMLELLSAIPRTRRITKEYCDGQVFFVWSTINDIGTFSHIRSCSVFRFYFNKQEDEFYDTKLISTYSSPCLRLRWLCRESLRMWQIRRRLWWSRRKKSDSKLATSIAFWNARFDPESWNYKFQNGPDWIARKTI